MSPSATGAEIFHGTALALGGKAVLIRGPSGSGKSDLALRCIWTAPPADVPYRAELVADDQVRLTPKERGIEAAPPPAIAGKIEVRGLGVLDLPYCPAARLVLAVDLVPPAEVPRYPLDALATLFFGLAVPTLRLAPFEASAPLKLIMALARAPDLLAPP